MKSFSVRVNRLFNAALGRGRGRVRGDRYDRRDLTDARQVRNALVYCLGNYKKHQGVASGAPRIDPCSATRWFEGWSMIRTHDDGPRPTEEARTVLLREKWWKHGFIHPGERPRRARGDVRLRDRAPTKELAVLRAGARGDRRRRGGPARPQGWRDQRWRRSRAGRRRPYRAAGSRAARRRSAICTAFVNPATYFTPTLLFISPPQHFTRPPLRVHVPKK